MSSVSGMPQQPPSRIGDADRHRAVDELGEHLASGRLSVEEHSERVDAALQAKYASDLEPLFADLPRESTAQPPTPAPVQQESPSSSSKFWYILPAMSPFIACIGFFLTNDLFDNAWVWFLLIPLSGAIARGLSEGDGRPFGCCGGQRRREVRDERRSQRIER